MHCGSWPQCEAWGFAIVLGDVAALGQFPLVGGSRTMMAVIRRRTEASVGKSQRRWPTT